MPPKEKRTSSKRILEVLEALFKDARPASAAALSDSLGIPLPTIYRQLEVLTNEGFVSTDATGKTVPGARLRTLLFNCLTYETSIAGRRQLMEKLSRELNETVSLSVPRNGTLVYFDRCESHWPIQKANIKVGDELPLTRSASGKLYLSTINRSAALEVFKNIRNENPTKKTIKTPKQFSEELDRIQKRGHAFDDEEWLEAMIGASVPIYNDDGVLCACLSTHTLTLRKSLKDLADKIPTMQKTAKKIRSLLLE